MKIVGSVGWALGFQQAVLDVIWYGKRTQSSNRETFSSLAFATGTNDVETLKKLIKLQPDLIINLNERDNESSALFSSAVRIASAGGDVEAFRLLLANGGVVDTDETTATSLAEASYQNREAIAKILVKNATAGANKNTDNNNKSIISSSSASATGSVAVSLPTPHSRAGVDLVKAHNNTQFDGSDRDGYTTPLLLASGSDGYNISSEYSSSQTPTKNSNDDANAITIRHEASRYRTTV